MSDNPGRLGGVGDSGVPDARPDPRLARLGLSLKPHAHRGRTPQRQPGLPLLRIEVAPVDYHAPAAPRRLLLARAAAAQRVLVDDFEALRGSQPQHCVERQQLLRKRALAAAGQTHQHEKPGRGLEPAAHLCPHVVAHARVCREEGWLGGSRAINGKSACVIELVLGERQVAVEVLDKALLFVSLNGPWTLLPDAANYLGGTHSALLSRVQRKHVAT